MISNQHEDDQDDVEFIDDIKTPEASEADEETKERTAFDCVADGDVHGLRLFLRETNCPINARNPVSGRSLLHDASARGDKKIVKFLIQETDADLFLRTMLGRCTALHLAVMNNHRPIVFLLLSHGADALSRDRFGSTPMHYVQSLSIAKLLIQYGGSVLDYNAKRKNALECALEAAARVTAAAKVDHDDDDGDAKRKRMEAATAFQKFLKTQAENEYKAKLAKLRLLKTSSTPSTSSARTRKPKKLMS